MNITKLPNSESAPPFLQDVIDELEQIIDADNRFTDTKKPENCVLFKSKCKLEFFCFYDSTLRHIPAYKNSIWVRINENNYLWLYVHANEKRKKKVCIFSKENLQCPNFPQTWINVYGLPPLNFNQNGCFIEKKRVNLHNVQWLLDEIILRLSCVCV